MQKSSETLPCTLRETAGGEGPPSAGWSLRNYFYLWSFSLRSHLAPKSPGSVHRCSVAREPCGQVEQRPDTLKGCPQPLCAQARLAGEHLAAAPSQKPSSAFYFKPGSRSPGRDSPCGSPPAPHLTSGGEKEAAARCPPAASGQPRTVPAALLPPSPAPGGSLPLGAAQPGRPRSPKMPCTMLKGLLSQSATHGMAATSREGGRELPPIPPLP